MKFFRFQLPNDDDDLHCVWEVYTAAVCMCRRVDERLIAREAATTTSSVAIVPIIVSLSHRSNLSTPTRERCLRDA